jgi:hypothetical protein
MPGRRPPKRKAPPKCRLCKNKFACAGPDQLCTACLQTVGYCSPCSGASDDNNENTTQQQQQQQQPQQAAPTTALPQPPSPQPHCQQCNWCFVSQQGMICRSCSDASVSTSSPRPSTVELSAISALRGRRKRSRPSAAAPSPPFPATPATPPSLPATTPVTLPPATPPPPPITPVPPPPPQPATPAQPPQPPPAAPAPAPAPPPVTQRAPATAADAMAPAAAAPILPYDCCINCQREPVSLAHMPGIGTNNALQQELYQVTLEATLIGAIATRRTLCQVKTPGMRRQSHDGHHVLMCKQCKEYLRIRSNTGQNSKEHLSQFKFAYPAFIWGMLCNKALLQQHGPELLWALVPMTRFIRE